MNFRTNKQTVSWFLPLLLGLLCSCNVYDVDDLCCTENDVMYFRLEYDGRDYFVDQIHSMRYLVFGGDGRFVCQLYAADGELNRVKIDVLDYGRYTMLAVANLQDYGWFVGEAGKGLSALCFYADDCFSDTPALNNGDPVYWGIGCFERIRGETNSYVTQLSNIHAVLHVKIEWEGVPASPSDCYLHLEGVGEGYSFDTSQARPIGIQLFPRLVGEWRSAVVKVPLRQMAIESRLLTLRYTDEHLPRLHVWQDGAELIRPINLEEVFGKWGWFADGAQVQDYSIRLLIRRDGSVVISPHANVGISDWVDGGTFG